MAFRILSVAAIGFALAGCRTLPADSKLVSIEFQTEPAGADVWVDGEFAGNTPLILRYGWSGIPSRKVEFRLSGYVPEARDFTKEMAVLAVMMKDAVEQMVLRVDSVPPGATVKVGPNTVGTTPLKVKVGIGSKNPQPPLWLTLPGYRSEAVPVESLRSGEPLIVHLKPLVPRLP